MVLRRSPCQFPSNLWTCAPACAAGRSAIRNISKHSGIAVLRARLTPPIAKRTTRLRMRQAVQGRHVRLIFSSDPRQESRDFSGSAAHAIWAAGDCRGGVKLRIAICLKMGRSRFRSFAIGAHWARHVIQRQLHRRRNSSQNAIHPIPRNTRRECSNSSSQLCDKP